MIGRLRYEVCNKQQSHHKRNLEQNVLLPILCGMFAWGVLSLMEQKNYLTILRYIWNRPHTFIVPDFLLFVCCFYKMWPFQIFKKYVLRDGNSGDSHLGKQVNWKLNWISEHCAESPDPDGPGYHFTTTMYHSEPIASSCWVTSL